MRFVVVLVSLVAWWLFVVPAQAKISKFDSHATKPEDFWQGSVQFGGIVNTGNNDNININGKITGDYHSIDWHHHLGVSGQLDHTEGKNIAERLSGNGESRYSLHERDYLFAKIAVDYDRFATFDISVRDAFGYGRVLFENERNQLLMELGPGSRHARISGAETTQNEFIMNIDTAFTHKLGDKSKFIQTVDVDAGHLNTHIRSESAVKTPLTDHIALQISFLVDHDTQIPPLSKNMRRTDTQTKLTVVYDF